MIILGITGGIGSGKSTVCRVFAMLGAPVFDADSRARAIMEENPEVARELKKYFGPAIYRGNKPDRKAIAGAVFKDPEKLKALNAIIHPVVKKSFERWCLLHQGQAYLIHEAAILIESGTHKLMDKNLLVKANKEIRTGRVMKRDGRSREQIEQIMGQQLSDDEKALYCHYTICNDGQQAIIPQILNIDQQLRKVAPRA